MRRDIVEALASAHGLDPDIVLAPQGKDNLAEIDFCQFVSELTPEERRLYSILQQAERQMELSQQAKKTCPTVCVVPWKAVSDSLRKLLDSNLRFAHGIPDSHDLFVVKGWKVYMVPVDKIVDLHYETITE
ncbi:MAG: hypothetical protein V1738_01035 [Patescibacteria group bacterium]